MLVKSKVEKQNSPERVEKTATRLGNVGEGIVQHCGDKAFFIQID